MNLLLTRRYAPQAYRERVATASTPHTASMIEGTTTTKIPVSLPPEFVAQAPRAVAQGGAASVNGYVAHAPEEQAKPDNLAPSLDDIRRLDHSIDVVPI